MATRRGPKTLFNGTQMMNDTRESRQLHFYAVVPAPAKSEVCRRQLLADSSAVVFGSEVSADRLSASHLEAETQEWSRHQQLQQGLFGSLGRTSDARAGVQTAQAAGREPVTIG